MSVSLIRPHFGCANKEGNVPLNRASKIPDRTDRADLCRLILRISSKLTEEFDYRELNISDIQGTVTGCFYACIRGTQDKKFLDQFWEKSKYFFESLSVRSKSDKITLEWLEKNLLELHGFEVVEPRGLISESVLQGRSIGSLSCFEVALAKLGVREIFSLGWGGGGRS